MSGEIVKGQLVGPPIETFSFVPGQGYSKQVRREALGKPGKAALLALLPGYADSGFTCRVDSAGAGKWALTATYGGTGSSDPNQERPTERWSWRKELIQRPIWSLPEVAKHIRSLAAPAEFKRALTQGVEDGKKFSEITLPTGADSALAEKIYNELVAGADSYETETIVLQRSRQQATRVTTLLVLNASSKIYTKAQLVQAEQIPTEVAAVLPAEPASVPLQSQWGWRRRDEEGDYEGPSKRVEQTTWAFAAWSTFLYTPFTPS